MLRYQKRNLLQEEDTSDAEEDSQQLHLKIIGHKNAIVRAFYYHQLRQHMKVFEQKEDMTLID